VRVMLAGTNVRWGSTHRIARRRLRPEENNS
jgi:hypothetical protein